MIVSLALAACGGAPPHPPMSAQATTALRPVEMGPPPGRVETLPPRPEGADAWVGGEWILRHGRWYWLLGRWVKTPPGATYSPWVVVRASDGTPFYAPSAWHDASGAVIPPPEPLALARASEQSVVSPEGEAQDTGRVVKTAPPVHPHPAAEPPPNARPSDTP
jgi:hypothetical protein